MSEFVGVVVIEVNMIVAVGIVVVVVVRCCRRRRCSNCISCGDCCGDDGMCGCTC